MVTQEELKRLMRYDPETGNFIRLVGRKGVAAGSVAGTMMRHGYIKIAIKPKQYLAHRLAWLYVHGTWPEGLLDHVNGDKADNRIENLRVCNKAQNSYNSKRPSINRSGVKGVCWHGAMNKWYARLTFNGVCKDLGFFERIEDAEECVRRARAIHHGEFARHE